MRSAAESFTSLEEMRRLCQAWYRWRIIGFYDHFGLDLIAIGRRCK